MPILSSDAAMTYLLGLELESAPVFDDLPVTEEQHDSLVLVGHDGSVGPDGVPDSDSPAASTTLDRAAFEQETRNEDGQITLAVIGQVGQVDNDLATCRTMTLAILTELDTALRADSTLGGTVADSWISGVDTFQGRDAAGASVRRVVTLSYEALQ